MIYYNDITHKKTQIVHIVPDGRYIAILYCRSTNCILAFVSSSISHLLICLISSNLNPFVEINPSFAENLYSILIQVHTFIYHKS